MSGKNQFLLECPVCRAMSLVVSNGKVYCPLCGYEADGKSGAVDWVNTMLGAAEQPGRKGRAIHECPECGAETLVTAGSKTFICFSCGNRWKEDELQCCPECYRLQPVAAFEELIICRSSVGFYVCRSCYGKIFK